jgi:hypothetical protein
MSQPRRHFVYQIFYDVQSGASLDPGFIPLDNTANERPDWYEFWVIRKFLKNNQLEDDAFYGFLSPRFAAKSGFRSDSVNEVLSSCHAQCDVALVAFGWDQLAYFLNPFEQGEMWHPGLMTLSQGFCDALGLDVRLDKLVTHSATSVFCNYVIAKPPFWRQWLSIADRLFDLVEHNPSHELGRMTAYGTKLNLAPMKAFIQERLATLILSQGKFRVVSLSWGDRAPIFDRLFKDDPRTRKMLETCDLMKEKYCRSGDDDYLKMFYKIRADIELTRPT